MKLLRITAEGLPLFKGVLDIYGTTNKLIIIYPIFGLSLMIGGIIVYIIKLSQT